MVTKKTNQFSLTKDQFEMLQQLLIQNQQAKGNDMTSFTCNIAHTGNLLAFSIQSLEKSLQIVDSRASDHMTGSSQNFSSYTLCPGNYKVRIVDGSLSTVARKRNSKTIRLSDSFFSFACPKNVIFFQLVNLPRKQIVQLNYVVLNVYFIIQSWGR